jgi:hypothetical protein
VYRPAAAASNRVRNAAAASNASCGTAIGCFGSMSISSSFVPQQAVALTFEKRFTLSPTKLSAPL